MNSSYARVEDWLFKHAWPFWSVQGVDAKNGGFVEYLDLQGRDGQAAYKRTRAQARQIYCFSQAALLGFVGGREIADAGWSFFQRARREDGGWVRSLTREGDVLDATSDAYDLAFVLFAHSWRFRLTGEASVLAGALEMLDVLDRDLATPNRLGWLAAAQDQGPRQQNPHMHLLEAALDLWDATGHARFADFAHKIIDLFERHILAERAVLFELFDEAWEPLRMPQDRYVEPGHMLEWVWILLRAQRLLKRDLATQATRLYSYALRYGADAHTGLIYDRIDEQGRPLSRDHRSWPQTEALKAHLAMKAVLGQDLGKDQDTEAEIVGAVDRIFRHYLDCEPYGTWIDHRRHDLSPKVDKIPSTTLYHLQLAFTELRKPLAERTIFS